MKPGDIVENGWASKDNPIRISIVIKDKGGIVVCTDGKGGIWDSPKGPKLKVIGHVTLSPAGAKEPDHKAMWEAFGYELTHQGATHKGVVAQDAEEYLLGYLEKRMKQIEARHTPVKDTERSRSASSRHVLKPLGEGKKPEGK